MSDFLNDTQLDEFKSQLRERQAYLTAQIQELKDQIKTAKMEKSADVIDQASNIQNLSLLSSELNQAVKSLSDVNKAINNFDEFGYCQTCGDEIDLRRLSIRPETQRCIHCQNRQEIHARNCA